MCPAKSEFRINLHTAKTLDIKMPHQLNPDWRMLEGYGAGISAVRSTLLFLRNIQPAHPFLGNAVKAWIDAVRGRAGTGNSTEWYSRGVLTSAREGRWSVHHTETLGWQGRDAQGRPHCGCHQQPGEPQPARNRDIHRCHTASGCHGHAQQGRTGLRIQSRRSAIAEWRASAQDRGHGCAQSQPAHTAQPHLELPAVRRPAQTLAG
jgi:hypothetical protein